MDFLQLVTIIDDDPVLTTALSSSLGQRGISCTVLSSFSAASDYISHWSRGQLPVSGNGSDGRQSGQPDVLIVDYHLDDGSKGAELCSRVRGFSDTPILMLTADSSMVTTLECLASGADQHMHKPFNMEELLARVHAAIRSRRSSISSNCINGPAGLRLDIGGRELQFDRLKVQLTEKEALLAEALISQSGKAVGKEELYRKVCNRDHLPDSRSLDVLAGRLRRKLARLDRRFRILSARSFGYKLVVGSHANG